LIIGGALIGVFYTVGANHWATTEYYWEGAFALFAAFIITVVGAALLRVSKMQDKWRAKLAVAMDSKVTSNSKKNSFKRWCERYAMFMLPFITVLREGLEAVVFVAGVTFSAPASAVPLPIFCGLLAGCAVGYAIYRYVYVGNTCSRDQSLTLLRGGASAKLQYFLVVSTCLLYLVAAALFSRGVWFFEAQQWNNEVGGDAAETGAGPGSYDISKSVWHVNVSSRPFITCMTADKK
jgi:high-affinity iron transporter